MHHNKYEMVSYFVYVYHRSMKQKLVKEKNVHLVILLESNQDTLTSGKKNGMSDFRFSKDAQHLMILRSRKIQ